MKIIRILLLTFIYIFFLFSTNNLVFAAGQDMPVLRQGEKHEAVYVLQDELKRLGFYQYEVDGNFGSGTKTSVVRFQQTAGLEADGVVGAETWLALRAYAGTGELSRGKTDRRIGQQIASFAQSFLGVPYAWGGAGVGGFDCSGFIYYVYGQYNVSLPRVADEQYNVGRNVRLADIEPGDLVFYSTYAPGPSHVGIYVGNGYFIHASSGAGQVTVTAMSKPYYQARFLGAYRVVR